MEYKRLQDLPKTITAVLPKDAQQVYLETYQRAWERFDEADSGGLDQDSVAHRDAWAEVTDEFERDFSTGLWHRKGEEIVIEEKEGLIDKIRDLFKGSLS